MRSLPGSLLVLTLFLASCGQRDQQKAAGPGPFDTAAAMRTLFGNFDPVTKMSFYRVPEGASSDPNFADKDEIQIYPLLTKPVTEDGRQKVYMLTWAKPAGQPFDCRGCAPLISAAVFVSGEQGWNLESVNRAGPAFGDFGKPPAARVVQIGPQRHAFLLRVTSNQANTTTRDSLLVPWKGQIQEALRTVVDDTNRGDCGGAYPCYANHRELNFVAGANSEYNDVALTLSGTDMSPKPPFRLHKVNGTERLVFEDGKYVPAVKTGVTITADND